MAKNTPEFDIKFKMADFLLGLAHGLGMLHVTKRFVEIL